MYSDNCKWDAVLCLSIMPCIQVNLIWYNHCHRLTCLSRYISNWYVDNCIHKFNSFFLILVHFYVWRPSKLFDESMTLSRLSGDLYKASRDKPYWLSHSLIHQPYLEFNFCRACPEQILSLTLANQCRPCIPGR